MSNSRYTGPKTRATIDGPEKFCTRCNEWWPADLEFFYSDPDAALGLFYCCKACYREIDKRPGRALTVQPLLFSAMILTVLQNFGGYK